MNGGLGKGVEALIPNKGGKTMIKVYEKIAKEMSTREITALGNGDDKTAKAYSEIRISIVEKMRDINRQKQEVQNEHNA